MDDVDIAQVIEGRVMEKVIENRLRPADGNGTLRCIDCEEIIPAARRKAIPGCERCVDCQEIYEAQL